MDYIVWVGHGDHDTEELPVKGVRSPQDAMVAAATMLLATHDLGWHIIDVLPVLPMPRRMQ